jgi:hypothetical protein
MYALPATPIKQCEQTWLCAIVVLALAGARATAKGRPFIEKRHVIITWFHEESGAGAITAGMTMKTSTPNTIREGEIDVWRRESLPC